MRYVRKQIVTKIIADEIVEDPTVIKGLLQTFQKSRTDATISYRKSPMDVPTAHERIRVVGVGEDSFDITVINQTNSMTVRKIPIAYIEYLCTTVTPSEVFIRRDSIEKGDLLDLS